MRHIMRVTVACALVPAIAAATTPCPPCTASQCASQRCPATSQYVCTAGDAKGGCEKQQRAWSVPACTACCDSAGCEPLPLYDPLHSVETFYDALYSAELWLLLIQSALLWRILRDLGAIDLDRLLVATNASSRARPVAAASSVADAPLGKEQREQFVELNSSGDSCGFTGDDLLRVMFACNFDKKLVQQKLARDRAWHDKYKPKQVTPKQLTNSLPSGTCRLGGFSKSGSPIVECDLASWRPFDYDSDEQHRLMAFCAEHALQRLPPGQDRLTVLVDLSGWRLSHAMLHPLGLNKIAVQLAQGPYAERLGVALLVNTPAVFRSLFRTLIQPLLSERVSSRVVMLGSDWREHVAEYVDDDNLPETLGGKRPIAGPPHFGFI